MNNAAIVVFAHDDYQAMFDMNLPFWEAHGFQILVVCPKGRPVETRHHVEEFGKIGSHGPQMVERHLKAMQAVMEFRHTSHYVFFECDALCITKELPLKNGLWGITFRNIHNGYGMFQEDWITWQYLNFPWVIDHDSLTKFVDVALRYPDVIEGGFVDRWVAAIAQAAGVPMVRFSPRGFSRSKINLEDPEEMEELRRVVQSGGTMFHGVKNRPELNRILTLRKKYYPNNP